MSGEEQVAINILEMHFPNHKNIKSSENRKKTLVLLDPLFY